ncbi:DoxX family membrane protein [Paenibacillus camelliae]|uniref:DoxX family membrane protein n=1 Tax=Paenibacillus camelliae TaxID=512410 RepID=UPI00203E72FE|nr:DoxX family membrane protein [Paenibacillus camelliae]MCM3634413.1 DoxX family membrane protein [Paenibacillus camelliae]
MLKFWRENKYAAIIVAVVRIILGYQWIKGGWGKVTGGGFDATGFMTNAINNPVAKGDEVLYPLYNGFIENVALPMVDVINVIVPWGELLVGIGLITGILTLPAAFFGLLMNFMFMFAGTVSTNPLLVLLGFIVMLAAGNAGRFGGDYFVAPWLKKNIGAKLTKRDKTKTDAAELKTA